MATLNKKQKLFIVRSLAVFNTPQETVVLVKEEFNTDVTRQQVETYDPTKRAGKDLSMEFKSEFEATRKDFLDKPETIPIANLAVRLQRYESQYQKHGKNRVAALSILKQAAEDIGGKYTNKTEFTGANGEPLNPEQFTHVVATPEQIRQAMDELESKY
ncbi:DUF2280 domain-containing protein [Acinetobacter beijerinckii]|uniref:DUF2280 domain-containing protein n=1 Tax=Acinetobacter beijerinckii TaxID=262668 RepID=UPI004054D25A